MPALCFPRTAHIDGVAINACITPTDSIGTRVRDVPVAP
jgi:hypothetical protein